MVLWYERLYMYHGSDLVIRYSYKSYQLNHSLLAVFLLWISASYISSQMLVSSFFVTCLILPPPIINLVLKFIRYIIKNLSFLKWKNDNNKVYQDVTLFVAWSLMLGNIFFTTFWICESSSLYDFTSYVVDWYIWPAKRKIISLIANTTW